MENQNNEVEELLEVWDWDKEIPTGKTETREKCHIEGIPHEGVHLWIIRTTDTPEILFQHRAKTKKVYPNVLDITVGGHVPHNLKEKKIHKEADEEIGLKIEEKNLIDLGYYKYKDREESQYNREFQRVYLMNYNAPLSTFSFNDGEVEGIYAVPIIEFKKLLSGEITGNIKAEGFNGSVIIYKTVGKDNFHPLLFAPSMKKYVQVLMKAINEYITAGTVKSKMSNIVIP